MNYTFHHYARHALFFRSMGQHTVQRNDVIFMVINFSELMWVSTHTPSMDTMVGNTMGFVCAGLSSLNRYIYSM